MPWFGPWAMCRFLQQQPRGTERRLACLYRAGLVVTSVDLKPGYIQVGTLGSTAFMHVHLDAGAFSIAASARSLETIIAPFLSSSSTLPILVGDFNCVTDPRELTTGTRCVRP